MSMFKFDRRLLSRTFVGAYQYEKNGKVYAEENFEIFENFENKNLVYASNFMSRLDNGEFLNIASLYEVSDSHAPIKVIIQRSLGTNDVEESFDFNPLDHKIHYTFETPDFTYEHDIPLSKRIIIMTPTMVTKCLFALNRKYEASARIPYVVMRSYNKWAFDKNPEEEHIFVEYETSKMMVRNINGEEYSTFDVNVYLKDTWKQGEEAELPTTFHITKNDAIPLHTTMPDGTIVKLSKLRKFEKQENLLG